MLRVVYPTSGGRIKRELAVPRLVDATLVIYPFADRIWGGLADQVCRGRSRSQ